jgi:hypothetical protein
MEKRLADEPIGPEKPNTSDDYRAFVGDLQLGDILIAEDGVREAVESMQPVGELDGEWAKMDDVETIVTLSYDSGEYQIPLCDIGARIAHNKGEVLPQ